MGLFGFGKKFIPNPYTRDDMQRDIVPSRINTPIYKKDYGSNHTPLECAILYGNPSIVKELIKNNADIYEKVRNNSGQSGNVGYPALVGYLRAGNLEMIKLLINEGFDVNTSDRLGTLLHHYVQTDKISIIKFLLKSGADVNSRGRHNDNATPVQKAAVFGNSKVLKLLIDAGGKVNVEHIGVSPLFEAVLGNSAGVALAFGPGNPNEENIRVLINAGANVNFCVNNYDEDGQSILDIAYLSNNEEVIKILIDAGATKRG